MGRFPIQARGALAKWTAALALTLPYLGACARRAPSASSASVPPRPLGDRQAATLQSPIADGRPCSSGRSDEALQCFETFRRVVIHSAEADVEEWAVSEEPTELLRFVLSFYREFPNYRRRVMEVLTRLLRSHVWAGCFLELSSNELNSLTERDKRDLNLYDELFIAERRRLARRRKEEIRRLPYFDAFRGSVESILGMGDAVTYANGAELSFGELRRLTNVVPREAMPQLLDNVDYDVPAATWDFLLRLCAERRTLAVRGAEVVQRLGVSQRWRSALAALPNVSARSLQLPEPARGAFLAIAKGEDGLPWFPSEPLLRSGQATPIAANDHFFCCCVRRPPSLLGVKVHKHLMVGSSFGDIGGGCPKLLLEMDARGASCACRRKTVAGASYFAALFAPFEAPRTCAAAEHSLGDACHCEEDATQVEDACTDE